MKSSACHSPTAEAADRPAGYKAVSANPSTTTVPAATPARMTVPRTAVPFVSPAPASQPPRSVEPRASPDEDAASKPVGTVVAVRRASVRIVSVVSVRACRRYADRTDSNSHCDLRLRVSHWNHQHRQQRNIFQVTHNHLRFRSVHLCQIRKPFQTLYSLEPSRPGKVAEFGVVDFSHLGLIQPLRRDGSGLMLKRLVEWN